MIQQEMPYGMFIRLKVIYERKDKCISACQCGCIAGRGDMHGYKNEKT